jgi:hypothetical protein
MRPLATISVLYFSLIAGGDCRAASGYPDHVPVLKEEPNGRMLSPSAIVLVDDGTCGKGRIKEVTGGEVAPAIEIPRTRRCIAKPRK